MSLKLGNIPIAGISQNTKYNAHHLLDFKWTDCIMNDVSWLRADTFSWQSGDVYTSAYNHLVADLQGATSETETIGSYTITFYRATDGHKITTDESTVANIYNETGISWYYILDTTNIRFKLPRTKYGFEGIRNNVGDNIEPGLPNIEGALAIGTGYDLALKSTGAFKDYEAGYRFGLGGEANDGRVKFNASLSNPIYGNSDTVQPPATQMYLYFYVGDYSQTAIEQTAGLNAELFNGKADIDGSNITQQFSTSLIQNMSDVANVYIAHNAMPSNTYTDLTLGASGSTYTAPADGYFFLNKVAGGDWYYIDIAKTGSHDIFDSDYRTSPLTILFPVKKNDIVTITYNATGTTNAFRFIYAVGSESEAS